MTRPEVHIALPSTPAVAVPLFTGWTGEAWAAATGPEVTIRVDSLMRTAEAGITAATIPPALMPRLLGSRSPRGLLHSTPFPTVGYRWYVQGNSLNVVAAVGVGIYGDITWTR